MNASALIDVMRQTPQRFNTPETQKEYNWKHIEEASVKLFDGKSLPNSTRADLNDRLSCDTSKSEQDDINTDDYFEFVGVNISLESSQNNRHWMNTVNVVARVGLVGKVVGKHDAGVIVNIRKPEVRVTLIHRDIIASQDNIVEEWQFSSDGKKSKGEDLKMMRNSSTVQALGALLIENRDFRDAPAIETQEIIQSARAESRQQTVSVLV